MRLAGRLDAELGAVVTLEQWTALNVPPDPAEARIETALATLKGRGEAGLAGNPCAPGGRAAAPADKRAPLTEPFLLEASRQARRI